VETPAQAFSVEIPAVGRHMIYPTLMAAAVGEHFGLTEAEIKKGILHFAPTKMRMNIIRRGGDVIILDDTYNANPQSMRAAIEVLSGSKAARKEAVLGDMLELGPLAPSLHRGIGDYLARAGVDCLIAVGTLAHHIYEAARKAGVPETHYYEDKNEALPILAQAAKPNTTILVKASRGMAFETFVSYLQTVTEP